MRITTSSMIRNYSSGLSRANTKMNSARDIVLTQRNFNKMEEDPGAAVQAFQLRREYSRNDDHLDNLGTVQSRYDSVESSAMQIGAMAKQVNGDILTAANGTTSAQQRSVFATNIREIQKSMVLSANSTFGDKFIFGGASTKEVPFVLSDDCKTLTYRGIDVNTSDPTKLAELKSLSEESLYVDMGFGLQEDASGKLITSTAFDMATPGINVLGYGVDENNNSNNMVTLLGQLADELEKSPFDQKEFQELSLKFTKNADNLTDSITQIGTKSNFLENTKTHLEDTQSSLNEKIVALEDVDLADAITNFMWAQFAYNAALKVGNNILSPSFIDFMN